MKKSTIILIITILVYFSAHAIIALVYKTDNSDYLVKNIKLEKEFHHIKISNTNSAFTEITVNEKSDTNEIEYTGNLFNANEFYNIENDTLSITIDSSKKNKIYSFDINASEIHSIKIISTDRTYFNLNLKNGTKSIELLGDPRINVINTKLDTINIYSQDSLEMSFNHSNFKMINVNCSKKIRNLDFNSSRFNEIKIN